MAAIRAAVVCHAAPAPSPAPTHRGEKNTSRPPPLSRPLKGAAGAPRAEFRQRSVGREGEGSQGRPPLVLL
ncbi:hypothetical protein AKJ08_0614 [Vulgatibacter incomptus]|uniref:Uncharacterized protein n=1 Tax=Vulgatibacter incomptus TaxID=1391653 RepID=A0A0K1P9Q3_9BACT|nr:hypothetical protein AKJ08_0614 [Vulgatibacter incomptus]